MVLRSRFNALLVHFPILEVLGSRVWGFVSQDFGLKGFGWLRTLVSSLLDDPGVPAPSSNVYYGSF